MRKIMRLGVLALTSAALIALAACKTDTITPVQGVSICDADDKAVETINLNIGEEIALTAKITPSDATNKNVNWSSSDDKIAKVDANGKVTGVGAGTATITVTTEDGGYSAAVEANVTANEADNTPPADDGNTTPPPQTRPEDDPTSGTVTDPSNNDTNNNNNPDEEIVEDDNTKIKATITPSSANDIGKVTIAIDENITLTAPKGFDKYTWYIDDEKVKEAEESVKKSKELKLVVDKDTKIITVDGTNIEIEEGLHSVMLIVNDELSATYYLEIKKQPTGGNV